MKLPTFVTHYYEKDRGPFLNICDLDDAQVRDLVDSEKQAVTAFNRFAIGPEFISWRRCADDLLVRAYTEKFGFAPHARPYFATLGSFDKTLTMFREGSKATLEISEFDDHELTFMYPDHAHLTTFYGSDAPHLFYQPPDDWESQPLWGRLFTFQELCAEHETLGIGSRIQAHLDRDGWAGCYVEAHIWCRDKRTNQREQNAPSNGGQRSSLNSGFPPRR
ncbi:hypothetical protein BH11VER1_BH11VER1_09210 [soil metagenome]